MTGALRVGLTGTPGSGKTTVSKAFSNLAETRSVSDLAEKMGFLGSFDSEEETREIDIENLVNSLERVWITAPDRLTIIEGHLAHHLPCDVVVVLRCDPDIIRDRLERRGYPEWKVNENVEWELMGSMWNEYNDIDIPWTEFDCTDSEVSAIVSSIIKWLNSGVPTTQSSMVLDWVSRKEGI